jgi:hypothetical protein
MTLIVEDGTGVEDANSYVSVEEADAYWADRSNYDWLSGDKEASLVIATAYIDNRYDNRWPGRRTYGRDQWLAGPRVSAYDTSNQLIYEDEIPIELRQAVCEAAFAEMRTPGTLFPGVDPNKIVLSKTVGPISTTYANPGSVSRRIQLTVVEDILARLIGSSAGASFVFPLRA